MRNFALRIWQLLGSDAFQVAVTFLLSGFLAGAFFTLLTRSAALEDIFFRRFEKFYVAQFSWYVAFGMFLVLGAALGFLVSLRRVEFVQKFRLTAARSFLAFTLVSAAIPLSYVLCSTAFPPPNFLLMWLVIPVSLVTTFSLAASVVTQNFRLLPVALLANFVSVVVAFGFHLLTFWLFREQGSFAIEFFEWASLFSSLSLSFGLCLLWQARGK